MDALRDDERQLVHAWDKSGLSRKVNVREILDRVEKAILQDKLQTLGAFIENQDVRLSHFKELYEQDRFSKRNATSYSPQMQRGITSTRASKRRFSKI